MTAYQLIHEVRSSGALWWFGKRLAAYIIVPIVFAAIFVVSAGIYSLRWDNNSAVVPSQPKSMQPATQSQPTPKSAKPFTKSNVTIEGVPTPMEVPMVSIQEEAPYALINALSRGGYVVFEFDRHKADSFLAEFRGKGMIFVFTGDKATEEALKARLQPAKLSLGEPALLGGSGMYVLKGQGVNPTVWQLIQKSSKSPVYLFARDGDAIESLEDTFKRVN